MYDSVYPRPQKFLFSLEDPMELTETSPDRESSNSILPPLSQLQEKQCIELIEMAQVRYGIRGEKIEVKLSPLNLDTGMGEAQIFKQLLTVPKCERADQILYALARGHLEATVANHILSSLAFMMGLKSAYFEGSN